jgi:hypothetical protein
LAGDRSQQIDSSGNAGSFKKKEQFKANWKDFLLMDTRAGFLRRLTL